MIDGLQPQRLLEYLTEDARPYHLLINFCANSVIRAALKPVVKNVDMEFRTLSTSLSRHHASGKSPDASKVFFLTIDIEGEGGKEAFRILGVTAVPALLALRGDTHIRSDPKGLLVSKADFIPEGAAILKAEMQGVFLKEKFGVDPGPMFRPTYKDSLLYLPFVAAASLSVVYLLWSFFSHGWYRSEGLYLAGALAVFWFSSGGYMYTIIRNMPFKLNNGFFYQGRNHQTGGEAIIIGGLYLLATLGFVALAYWLPKIKVSPKQKKQYAYAALGTSSMACLSIFHLASWKEQYSLLDAVFKYPFVNLLPFSR